MARVSNPLIGATSGSVGGVTFSKWKGIDVIKTKPTVVANPKSDAQVAQRSAFSFMVSSYRLMVAIIVLGFKEMAIKKSAFNAFVSANLKSAFDLSSPPTATFLPTGLLISKGTMSDTTISDIDLDEDTHKITFTFSSSPSLPGQSATDKPLLAAWNKTKSEWASAIGSGTRNTGTAELTIPSTWEETDEAYCYLGFSNAAGDSASDSKVVPWPEA